MARVPILVGDHRLSVEIVTPKTDMTLNSEKYATLDSRITSRLYQMFLVHGGSGMPRSDDSVKLAKVIARAWDHFGGLGECRTVRSRPDDTASWLDPSQGTGHNLLMTDLDSGRRPARRHKRSATARVLIARIVPPVLPARVEMSRAIEDSLIPGTWVERYGRTWRMGQLSPYRRTVLGRIGYSTEETVDIWDANSNDFFPSLIPLGQTSLFAIHTGLGRVAFQRRATISPNGFAGAFATLLDVASPYLGWEVEVEEKHETLQEFVESVDQVKRISITLRPPNPNYKGRQTVRHLVEETRVELARLVLEGDDIDLTDVVVQEAIDHAAEYGKITAVGERGSTRVPWDSEKGRAAEELIVLADPDTGEADSSALRREAGETD